MWAAVTVAARRQWRPQRQDGTPGGDSTAWDDDSREALDAPHPGNNNNIPARVWEHTPDGSCGGKVTDVPAPGSDHNRRCCYPITDDSTDLIRGGATNGYSAERGRPPIDTDPRHLGSQSGISWAADGVDGPLAGRDTHGDDVTPAVSEDAMLTLGHVSESFPSAGLGGAMYKASTIYDLSMAPGLSDDEEEEDHVAEVITSWTLNLSSPPQVTCDDSVWTTLREPRTPEPTWTREAPTSDHLTLFDDDHHEVDAHTIGLPALCTDYKRARTRDFWADDEDDEMGDGEEWDEGTYIWDEDENDSVPWCPPPWSCHGPCPGKRSIDEYRYFTPGHLDVIVEDDELAIGTAAADIDTGASSSVRGSEGDTMEGHPEAYTDAVLRENGLTNGDLNHSSPPPDDMALRKKQKVIYIEEHMNGSHFVNDEKDSVLNETHLESWCSVGPPSAEERPGSDRSATNGPVGTTDVKVRDVTDDDDVIDEEVAASSGQRSVPQPGGESEDEKAGYKTGELINMDELDKMVLTPDAKPITVTETVTLTTTEYLANGKTRKRTEIIKTTKTVEPVNATGARQEEGAPTETVQPSKHPEPGPEDQHQPAPGETPISVTEVDHVTSEPPTALVEEEPPITVTSEPEIVTSQTSQLMSTEPPHGWTHVEAVPSLHVEPVALTTTTTQFSETKTREPPRPITVNITVEASVQSPPPFEDIGTSETEVPRIQNEAPVYLPSPYTYNAILLDSDVIADLVYSRFRPTVSKKKIIILLFPLPYQNLEPEEVKSEVIQPVQASVETTMPPQEEDVMVEPEEEKEDAEEVMLDAEEDEPKASRKKGNIFRRMAKPDVRVRCLSAGRRPTSA